MTILQAIYQLLFGPLELFFEVVYGVAFHIVDGNAGAAVIPLSFCLNFLLSTFCSFLCITGPMPSRGKSMIGSS